MTKFTIKSSWNSSYDIVWTEDRLDVNKPITVEAQDNAERNLSKFYGRHIKQHDTIGLIHFEKNEVTVTLV